MDTTLICKKFESMGARVKFSDYFPNRFFIRPVTPDHFSINIAKDNKGEIFEIFAHQNTPMKVSILDVAPEDRHLVLMVKEQTGDKKISEITRKFLCGHDERFWFVAAVPETAKVSNVATAKEALKPAFVRVQQFRKKVKTKERNKRKNAAFLRQGEWFFIPQTITPEANCILYDEPIRRSFSPNGRGKPHLVEYLYRTGGETVYVSRLHSGGLTESQYKKYLQENPHKKLSWQTMKRNPQVYAKGRISHPDHKTLILSDWHLVLMNTESQARAMQNVAFLD